MKIAEILFLCADFMKILHKYGVRMDDYKYVELYKDYCNMRLCGDKTSYIVAVLADHYKICERQVYKVLKKLDHYCQINAVEQS